MIAKVLTGIDFFDQEYGGAYRGRVMLATGRAGAGKTALALQFLAKGLDLDERCLLLSARPAEDVALHASAQGLPVDTAMESGKLIILEYNSFVPGRDREDQMVLPPDSFLQLKDIIEEQAVERVVIDSVLPWVALRESDNLPEHIFSFVRVFQRLGTTSLFTLPKPVSIAAVKLRRLLEDVVPISITLQLNPDDGTNTWIVNKYLGSDHTLTQFPIEIKPKAGIVRKSATRQQETVTTPMTGPSFAAAESATTTRRPAPAPPPTAPAKKPSFSDLLKRNADSPLKMEANTSPQKAISGWASMVNEPGTGKDGL